MTKSRQEPQSFILSPLQTILYHTFPLTLPSQNTLYHAIHPHTVPSLTPHILQTIIYHTLPSTYTLLQTITLKHSPPPSNSSLLQTSFYHTPPLHSSITQPLDHTPTHAPLPHPFPSKTILSNTLIPSLFLHTTRPHTPTLHTLPSADHFQSRIPNYTLP